MGMVNVSFRTWNHADTGRILNHLRALGSECQCSITNQDAPVFSIRGMSFFLDGGDDVRLVLELPDLPNGSSGGDAVGEPRPPRCSGPVTLVNDNGSERYAEVAGLGTWDVLVKWCGDADGRMHSFSRLDGSCIESHHSVMKGWRIHPDELADFKAPGVKRDDVTSPVKPF